MRELPRPAAIYLIAVVSAGAAILVRSALRIPLSGGFLFEVLLFLLLGLTAEIKRVSLGAQVSTSVSTAINFAAAIIFGPYVAIWVSAITSVAADVWFRKPLYKIAFNAALFALSVAAGAAAMEATRGNRTSALVPADIPAFALYAVANQTVNHILLSAVIGLAAGVLPWQVARENFEGVSLPIVALYPLGVLMAVAYVYFGGWVGLLLLSVPVVAVYNALDKAQELRAQTQRALEAVEAREAAKRRLVAQAEELAKRDAEAAALRELDRVKNEFISTVSHELRTPLTIVHCYADLLCAQFRDLPAERVTTMARDMLDSTTLLARLIDDMLDFARAEQGTLAIHPEVVDVAPLLHQVAAAYRRQSGGDRLRVDLPDHLIARADGGRVVQIVSNLLANALKYAPSGPILLRGRTSDGQGNGPSDALRDGPAAGHVLVEVVDHGPGIAPDEQPHVWEKFFRGHDVAAANTVRGTGIGLAVVRTLVEAHGGQVGLESAAGQGARFWFTLPTMAGAPAPALPSSDQPHLPAQPPAHQPASLAGVR